MQRSDQSHNVGRKYRWAAFLFALAAVVAPVDGQQAGPARQETGPAPLRVAIVGLEHGHVEGFLSALPQHNQVQLVAISDPDPALWAKYEKKFGLDHGLFFADMDKMIDARHPQVVLVYTSIQGHRKVIETAARHGVSVMVEKPLTISLDDALAIRKTAREAHIHVLTNYETTWYASNLAAYDQAEEGKLGEIRRVVIHDGHQGPKEIGVPPEFLNFLTDPAQNGAGALYDFGCYGADLMVWLMHGETPLTVTAVLNHDKPDIYPKVDDDATVVLTYPHAQAVIQASWNWPFGRKDMEVYGATGYAITVGTDQLRIRHEHDDKEDFVTARPLPANFGDSLSYLAAVMDGQIVTKDGSDFPSNANSSPISGVAEDKWAQGLLDTNVVVMQILDAARESARTGRTVRLTKLGQ